MAELKNLYYLTIEAPREGSASYTHVYGIVSGLKKRGWEVSLFKPSFSDKPVSPNLFMRLLHSFVLQAKFWARWKRGSVIYMRAHYLAFPTCLIAKIFGIPVFHEINGPYEDVFAAHPSIKIFSAILIIMQRLQFRWATGLIAVTGQLRDFAEYESRGVISVTIPNGANIDLFHDKVPLPSESLPEKYVIFFGSVSAWHRVDVMVSALQSSEWPADVHLVVIGDGPKMDDLRKGPSINKHLLHLLGRRPYQLVPGYVRGALAGLVTTKESKENTGLFPLKLFETLACGVPAIVTDFRGQADLIRDNNCGLVIPADDAEALAKSVRYLSEHKVERDDMGLRAAELIHKHHSWDSRAGDTDQFIRNILAK